MSGQLPGAYKAGRSWRIPPSALSERALAAVNDRQAGPLTEPMRQARALLAMLGSTDAVGSASEANCDEALAVLERLRTSLTEFGKAVAERRREINLARGLEDARRQRLSTPRTDR